MNEDKRRGGAIAALLAVGALGLAAVPAYGALNGASDRTQTAPQSAPSFVQDERREQQPRDGRRDRDCPFKDGQGRGEGDRDQGQGGGTAPEGVSSDSAARY